MDGGAAHQRRFSRPFRIARPSPCGRARPEDDRIPNLLAIQRVLEEAGVIFLDPGENREGGVGVRLWITR